jgi:hypothetical protein
VTSRRSNGVPSSLRPCPADPGRLM